MSIRRGLLVLLGAVVVLVTAAAPASAHNSLTATAPTDRQVVAVAPTDIVLTFNEPAIAMGTQIVVTGPSGQVQQGQPQLVDSTVRQALAGDAPAGDYTVTWRVTSADGHPITGSFTFTATAGGTGAPAATAPTEPESDQTSGGPGFWLWLVPVLGIAAFAAVAVLTWRRLRPPRRHDDASSTDDPTP